MKLSKNTGLYYLLLLCLIGVPVSSWQIHLGTTAITADLIFGFVLIVQYLFIKKSNKWQWEKDIRTMLIPFLVYLLVMALSIMNAESIFESIKDMLRFVINASIFYIVLTFEFTETQRKNLLRVLCLFVSFISVYGFIQYVFDFGIAQLTFGIEGAKGRIQSVFDNPNEFASFLNIAIPSVIVYGILQQKKKWAKLFGVLILYFSIFDIIVTYTRTAWVILFLNLILTAVFYWKPIMVQLFKNPVFLAMVLVLAFSIMQVPEVGNRIYSTSYSMIKMVQKMAGNASTGNMPIVETSPSDETRVKQTSDISISSRMMLWETGWVIYKQNPILGVGAGNYPLHYKQAVLDHPELEIKGSKIITLHNSYLKILTETGVFGLLSFLAIFGALGWVLWNNRKTYMAKLLALVLIGYMLHNVTDNMLFTPQLNTFFWIFMAFGLNQMRIEAKQNKKDL